MTSVLCIGEGMVELSLSSERPDMAGLGFAGDTLNTAIYLKRSAPELTVRYATKLGRDTLSDRMMTLMQDEALDTSLVFRSDALLPGLYAIHTDAMGERTFTYWRENSAARQLMVMPGLTEADLVGHDLVFLSAISLAILPSDDRSRLLDWLKNYRAAGGQVAFDSNHRPALWPSADTARETVEAMWQQTDIALPSVDDECALFGDSGEDAVMNRLRNLGVKSGALKRGQLGPRALDGSASPACDPVEKVVDSTAAGDSFNAGYLAARLAGATETDALLAGHTMAAKVLQYRGAIVPRDME